MYSHQKYFFISHWSQTEVLLIYIAVTMPYAVKPCMYHANLLRIHSSELLDRRRSLNFQKAVRVKPLVIPYFSLVLLNC
jgi:hypothetical protein